MVAPDPRYHTNGVWFDVCANESIRPRPSLFARQYEGRLGKETAKLTKLVDLEFDSPVIGNNSL